MTPRRPPSRPSRPARRDLTTALAGSTLRTLAGDAVPGTGRWDLDPDRTAITLVGRRLIGTTVRARFTDVASSVVIGVDPEGAAGRWDLRVTEIFRKTGDGWRRVHRHADPLVDRRGLGEAVGLLE